MPLNTRDRRKSTDSRVRIANTLDPRRVAIPKDLNTRSDQKSILALSRAVAPIRSEMVIPTNTTLPSSIEAFRRTSTPSKIKRDAFTARSVIKLVAVTPSTKYPIIERKNIPTERIDKEIRLRVPMNTNAMERRRSEAIRNGNKTNVCAHPPEPTKAKMTIYDAIKSAIGDRFIFHAKTARQPTLTMSHTLIVSISFIL